VPDGRLLTLQPEILCRRARATRQRVILPVLLSIDNQWEEQMDKICALARLIGVIVAIAAAFVAIPQTTTILLILGGISIFSYKPDDYVRIYASAIVLILGGNMLSDIPVVGLPLAAIFGNLGTFLVGSSIVAITLRAFALIKADWVK
jgi:phosphatidylserine synthase